MDAAVIAGALILFGAGLLLGRLSALDQGVCELCGWPKDRMVCQGCADRTLRALSAYAREVVADRDRLRERLADALAVAQGFVDEDFAGRRN